MSQVIDALWECDLVEVASLLKDNDGIRYLLIANELFWRYMWVRAV